MDPKQQNEKRKPDQQQQFPGKQPQRTPSQKPEHERERERKED